MYKGMTCTTCLKFPDLFEAARNLRIMIRNNIDSIYIINHQSESRPLLLWKRYSRNPNNNDQKNSVYISLFEVILRYNDWIIQNKTVLYLDTF